MIDETNFLDLGTEGAKWFTEVNNKWLNIIGKRVKDIGSISATDLRRLDQLSWYSTDMATIRRELAVAAGKTDKELAAIFKGLASAGYADAKKYYDARGVRFVPYSDNMGLLAVVDSIEKNTAGMWKNFANTTVNQVWSNGNITAGDVYKDVIDEAISDAQLGMTDYKSAMRNTLKKVADEGISYVNYDSGARRRLDFAARMNILDGMRQIGMGVQNYVGQQFGADGWEISVHTSPAPDHAHIQGRQYTKLKYEDLNDSLERRIGTCNCYHFAFAIIVGVSAANYSQKELDDILAENDRKRVFEGKEYTGYEATQKQRQIETEIRRRKDRANLAKASGDDVWRREEQARINALRQKYSEFSQAVGLDVKRDRMSVRGFHTVKAQQKKIISGGISGALDPFSSEADKHAAVYYESVRHMKDDFKTIAKNTGYKEEDVLAIKNYLFNDTHDLGERGKIRFDSSFQISRTWQRLIEGKNIKPCDRILIEHELLEKQLVESSLTQDEAHIIASKKYNYIDSWESG